MTQRTAVTFRASPEVLAAIDARANAEFCKRGEAVASLLEAAVAQSSGATSSPMADIKEKSAAADLEMKQMRLQQLRKELITVDAAITVVESVFAEMKTEGLGMVRDLARDFKLDSAACERRFLAAMAGPFAVQREPFQREAEEFSYEPLP